MSITPTPNMGLTRWTAGTDFFNWSLFDDDWLTIDDHDHTSGKGRQIPAGGLAADSVATTNIQNNAVTQAKIATDAVGSAQIASSAVGTSEVANNAIDASKIATNAVTTTKIAGLAVSTAKIAPFAITAAQVADAILPQTKLDLKIVWGWFNALAAPIDPGTGDWTVDAGAAGYGTTGFYTVRWTTPFSTEPLILSQAQYRGAHSASFELNAPDDDTRAAVGFQTSLGRSNNNFTSGWHELEYIDFNSGVYFIAIGMR